MKLTLNLRQQFELNLDFYKNELALIYPNKEITYNDLDQLSNQLANYLIGENITNLDVIGIVNTKSFIGYACMLACIKIGAIYTNIDEHNPLVRMDKIFNVCKPKIIIIDHVPSDELKNILDLLSLKYSVLASVALLKSFSSKRTILAYEIIGSQPAYIMFTSGSTGTPKGVVVSHDNILSFLKWSIPYYEINTSDRFAQLSPLYFDNSVFDFYTALFGGASLVPIRKEMTKNAAQLVDYVSRKKCTIWFSVPSLLVYLLTMRVLTPNSFVALRVITFGGEGFPKGALKKLYNLYSNRIRFVNVYGPTEATCICSAYEIKETDFEDMIDLAPLGLINPNFDFLILNENSNKVGLGSKGELYLIGSNVALGYYNDTELTNLNFIQNPVHNLYRDVVYKTGDIVFQKDGLLHFSGRLDNQIKHMGYRIELEEIEAALNSLSYVAQSAVLYERTHANYGKIIAFVACVENIEEVSIKDSLEDLLPYYMIPNVIVLSGFLPLNKNGKVDKKVLKFYYRE